MRDSSGVFLSLNKKCEQVTGVIAFRVPQLCSYGGAVISQRAYPEDERLYKDIVDFGSPDEIPRLYAKWRAMSKKERRAEMARRSKLFRTRFEPKEIFKRAGIYDLLDRAREQSKNENLPPV